MKLLPSNPLARDITVVLVVKLVLITALWMLFFRSPDHGRALDAAAVEHAVFERAPASGPEDMPASAHSNASMKGQP
jgi:hypothetical protein